MKNILFILLFIATTGSAQEIYTPIDIVYIDSLNITTESGLSYTATSKEELNLFISDMTATHCNGYIWLSPAHLANFFSLDIEEVPEGSDTYYELKEEYLLIIKNN